MKFLCIQKFQLAKPLDTDLANIEYIQLDHLIKNKSRNSFACKVNGESMNSYGIQSGDIVILDSNKRL